MTCWIGAKIEEEGAITIPAKLLSDVVGGLPNDKISMALDARTQTVNLTCARFEASIKGIEADEFPIIPTFVPAPKPCFAAIGTSPLEKSTRYVVVNRKLVLFHTESTDLDTRPIEDRYPDIERIIPSSYATRTVLETQDLVKAVKLASYFATASSNIVRLTIESGGDLTPGQLTISATRAKAHDLPDLTMRRILLAEFIAVRGDSVMPCWC